MRESGPKPAEQELIEQAVAAFRKGNTTLCLELWEQVRRQFPAQPQGYIRAGFAALELGKTALAESLAAQAVEKFPRALNAWLLSAEVAMRSCAFATALARWTLVRKNFPGQPQGYIRAVFAALELGKTALAESLVAQAEEKFPDAQDVPQLRAKLAEAKERPSAQEIKVALPDLLDIAEKDLRLGLFKQAFAHFRLAMHHLPAQIRGYLGAAEAAVKLKKYLSAESICADAIARFPLHPEGYKQLVLCLEAQGKTERALAELETVKKKFPELPYGWLKYAELQVKAGNYERADAAMQEAVRLFPDEPDIFVYFAQLPTLVKNSEVRGASLERFMMLCHRFASSYQAYFQTLRTLYKLSVSGDAKNIFQFSYPHILDSFLQHFRTEEKPATASPNLPPHKIAVYVHHANKLYFILPVIKHIQPDFIDIIINTKASDTVIKNLDIDGYNILYGKESLNTHDYAYIIADFYRLEELKDYKCNFIGYTHATDSTILPCYLDQLSLAIFSSKNQIADSEVISCDPLPDWYTLPSHADYTCELCHTGPYHLGTFLKRRHEPRPAIKAELTEELGIDIPKDRPLVFMLEDEYCHIGQLAYAANNISRYATVIYKTFFPPTESRLSKFNKDIHIVRGPLAPNLMRFSADYICCGFLSGSFATSVMLGQNVLPYYSRLLEKRNKADARFEITHYREYRSLQEQTFSPVTHTLYSRFSGAGKLLDLANAAAFKNAILGTDYREWYCDNLPDLQKEVFGDYMLEDAPRKTAEYIMRFVKEGTLGKDCSAVYLKKSYFK